MRDRLIQLLGNGVSHAVAASAVGCSESYVTQLVSNPAVAEEIAALRFENLQAATVRDSKIDSLEDKLLVKFEEALPLMMRPAEIMRAAAVVNAMKRRGQAAPETAHIANQIVNLFMPKQAAISFQLSSNKEIIEVAGRPLVTMPSAQLLVEAKHHAQLQQQFQIETSNNLSGAAHCEPADKQAA